MQILSFIKRVFLFSSVFLAILICSLIFYRAPADHYLRANEYKFDLLHRTSSPKLVFIGDSNLAFGINSQLLSDSLQKPVVNTALIGHLGLAFSIEQHTEGISEDDLVLVSLNLRQLTETGQDIYGKEQLGNLIALKPSNLAYIDSYRQVPRVTKGLIQLALDNISNLVSINQNKTELQGYISTDFNEYGDYKANISPDRRFKFRVENYTNVPSEKNIEDLNSELLELKSKTNATILVIGPPLPESYRKELAPYLTQLYDRLAEQLSFPVISDYNSYFFPDSLFYDTDKHLIQSAASYRTLILLDEIKRYLEQQKYSFSKQVPSQGYFICQSEPSYLHQ